MLTITPSAEEITIGSLRVTPTGGVRVSQIVESLSPSAKDGFVDEIEYGEVEEKE